MSDNSLDGLIAKVKTEAIDKAEQEAQQIINDAKEKASQIIKAAETNKEEVLEKAELEAEEIVHKGNVALQQAARDLEISVKNDLLKLFNSVFENKLEESFSPNLYEEVVKHVVNNLGDNTKLVLPDDVSNAVVESVKAQVANSKYTIDIIKDKKLLSGLSISKENEGWSYDISAEAIKELLSQQLSQKWMEILNQK